MELKDYLNSVNDTKEDIIIDDISEKQYPPFIVNKCLASFIDCIFFSNNMNLYPFLDKKIQYHYYLHSLRKKKRFSKWLKKEKTSKIEIIKEYFNYSDRKAEEAEKVLTESQIEQMKKTLNKGGCK